MSRLSRFRRGRSAVEPRLLWIFGSPRSGSTWLLQMLGSLPRVTAVDEPLIGLHLAPFVCDRPGVFAADLDTSNFTFNRVAREKGSYFFAERYADAWLQPLGDLLRARFAAVSDSGLIAIKEPNGSQAADLILQALPRARLLFLLRDGRDVVDSLVAGHGEGGWLTRRYPMRPLDPGQRLEFVEDAAHKWVWQTEVVEAAYAAHPGPKLLVRYEDLHGDTAREMARVLEWLGLEGDPAALGERFAFERQANRGTTEFVRSASPGAWASNLSAREQEALNEIVGPTLARLGYGPPAHLPMGLQ